MQSAQELLVNEFEKRKKHNPNFSLRSFARWLSISPAQLSQMMSGKRAVTGKTVQKISAKLGFTPFEKKNLLNLTVKRFQDAETFEAKKTLKLEQDKFLLISDWYHFAILSLTKIKDAKPDPRWIAARLGINASEANKALERLKRLGVLQLKPEFKQIADPIEVIASTPSEAIRKYHKQILALAIDKIDSVNMKHREYQSVTVHMKPTKIVEFKKLIDEFLDQAQELAEGSSQSKELISDEVYNLNVQLFPLTKIKGD